MTDDEKLRAQISAEVFADEPAGDVRTDPPSIVQEPELKSEPSEPVDAWAGVAPALRARMEQLEASMGEFGVVKERLQQAERRVGALTNDLHESKKKPEPKEPPVEHESIARFREDYPDVAGPIEERLAALRAEILNNSPTIDEVALRKTITEQVAFDIAVERVEEVHPGWQKTIEQSEFRNWQRSQPADVQQLALSPRAVDAIRMFDKYAEFKKGLKPLAEIEAERNKRLEQSQSTDGRMMPQSKSQADMNHAELRAAIAAEVFSKT